MITKAAVTAPQTADQTSFGDRTVATAAKQGMVDEVFHRVADRYDLMNDLMTGGLHRLWKDAFVSWLAPPRRGATRYSVLDLAGGSGDIAFRILQRSTHAEAIVADINPSMLAVGRQRARGHPFADRISFVKADAENLDFEDGSFEAVTIAFGIRNVPRIERALSEINRVLKPGGRFLCLEFSTVDVAVLDRLYDFVSFQVIPRLGGMVVGDEAPYQYLVESIRKFPHQARFGAMIEAAGLERVSWRNLSGGIAAMHSAWKV